MLPPTVTTTSAFNATSSSCQAAKSLRIFVWKSMFEPDVLALRIPEFPKTAHKRIKIKLCVAGTSGVPQYADDWRGVLNCIGCTRNERRARCSRDEIAPSHLDLQTKDLNNTGSIRSSRGRLKSDIAAALNLCSGSLAEVEQHPALVRFPLAGSSVKARPRHQIRRRIGAAAIDRDLAPLTWDERSLARNRMASAMPCGMPKHVVPLQP